MLKEKGIAVFFEDENINTLTMDGELLLVVLSSVAQQEVENISSNVKKGLKMKMQRGELVGFQGCLGYDYHKDTKSISVNEKEAEIVRYIFNRYIEGAGCTVIGNELENLRYKTKYGSSKWVQSTVIGIIKNEKYKGDLLLGKTFTVDPISKRRLENFGEEDKFYIRDHHEPIISEEIFEEAQKILAKRNTNRNVHQEEQERLMELSRNQDNTRTRLREFRKVLGSGEILESFDRAVFESVVEKIVIGGYNDEGVEEPLKITFVYKTGIHSNFNGKDFKPKRKNAAAVYNDAELCPYTSDEAEKLCLHSSSDTHRMCGGNTKKSVY